MMVIICNIEDLEFIRVNMIGESVLIFEWFKCFNVLINGKIREHNKQLI